MPPHQIFGHVCTLKFNEEKILHAVCLCYEEKMLSSSIRIFASDIAPEAVSEHENTKTFLEGMPPEE